MPEFVQSEIKTVGLGEEIDLNDLLWHSDDGMTKEEFLELIGKGSENENKKLIFAIEKVFAEKEKEITHADLEEQFIKMYDKDPDSAWRALMTTIISASFPEEMLEHHGIDGQKWGVRNGPPYPLERQKGKHLSVKEKARIILRESDDLTLDELRHLVSKLELEEKLTKMSEEEKKKGKGYVTKGLEKFGDTIVSVAVPAATTYAFKKIVENVGGEDVVAEMFPKKK
ncbi:MAG: hypothetical protein J6X94_03480 [Lachnospiraceae bacterium]|nr:hypothetical protein [Lachnospiraceae bacterium]